MTNLVEELREQFEAWGSPEDDEPAAESVMARLCKQAADRISEDAALIERLRAALTAIKSNAASARQTLIAVDIFAIACKALAGKQSEPERTP